MLHHGWIYMGANKHDSTETSAISASLEATDGQEQWTCSVCVSEEAARRGSI